MRPFIYSESGGLPHSYRRSPTSGQQPSSGSGPALQKTSSCRPVPRSRGHGEVARFQKGRREGGGDPGRTGRVWSLHQRPLHRGVRRHLRLVQGRMRRQHLLRRLAEGHGGRGERDHSAPDVRRRLRHQAPDIDGLRPEQASEARLRRFKQGRARRQDRIRDHRAGRGDGLRGLCEKEPMA